MRRSRRKVIFGRREVDGMSKRTIGGGRRGAGSEAYYPGTDTLVIEPFYHTVCTCGKEFLRLHRVQVITCPHCGRTFEAKVVPGNKKAC